MMKRIPTKGSFFQVRVGFCLPLFRALGPHLAMECGPGVDQNAGSSNEHGQIRNWSKVGKRRVELKPAASILVGVVVPALLFPTGGGSGFPMGQRAESANRGPTVFWFATVARTEQSAWASPWLLVWRRLCRWP
jgi:hypothetical protein